MTGFAAISASVAHAQVLNVTGNQTVTIRNGDRYDLVGVGDTSTVNMIGGNVNEIDTFNTSNVNVNGGTLGFINSQNSSKATISGGTLSLLLGTGTSTLTVTGGSISNLDFDESAAGTTSGGILPLIITVDGNVGITGGATDRLRGLGLGTTTLTGFNFAVTSLTQGIYNTTNFTYNGTYYTITGRLQNSATALTYNLFDANTRTRTSTGATTLTTGKFILNDLATGRITVLDASAPEPASLALLGFGIVGSVDLVRRRSRFALSKI